jgi:hypothetical protein
VQPGKDNTQALRVIRSHAGGLSLRKEHGKPFVAERSDLE